jgi:hypothetical protein
MEMVVGTETEPLSTGRALAFPFRAIGKILQTVLRIILIVALINAGVGSLWLMGKVETRSGEAFRWQVGQAWVRDFLDMPGVCKSGYGMGILVLPVGVIGEPVAAVIDGEIEVGEIPGRIKMLIQDFWEMSQGPVGLCPALFPPAETLTIE